MAIDMGRALTSVGVGVADEVMEWWDEKSGRTESFRTAKDISRLALAGLGYGLQVFMPRYARFGDTLATAYTPLLIKSIAKPIRGAIGTSAGAREQVFVPRRRAVSFPAAPVASPAAPVASPVGRSYYPETTQVLMQ